MRKNFPKKSQEISPTSLELVQSLFAEEEDNSKGFDTDSAKYIIQEIAHNTNNKPEVRLKAAETILKVTGAYKENDEQDGSASILAQLLSDMFKSSENKPKIPMSIEELSENDLRV